MKRNYGLYLTMLVMSITTIIFWSCSSDDPYADPDSGETVSPSKNVDDPEGTIILSMRNTDNGGTRLGNIRIEKGNFEGAYFASLGSVKGLRNVSYIPLNGWAEKMAVIAGYGYVACSNNQFYRIFVVSDIIGTNGNVIGAEIKYQKPFKGRDEAIKTDKQTLSFNAEGGSQTIVFTNDNLVQSTAESNQPWCHVTPSSTTEFSFLYNGIDISVDKSIAKEIDNATITITTTYGKTHTINVTREAANSNSLLECPDSNHPHLIDLGLPSGTKWACCNVGASSPEQYGGYYAWGEIEGKTSYTQNNYKYYENDKYVSLGSDIAGTQYDVANVKWGGKFRIPSLEQCRELVNKCSYEWTTLNNVWGVKIIGPSGGYIFLPATGRRDTKLWWNGSGGCYWSSTQYSNYYEAYDIEFLSAIVAVVCYDRYYGHTIRPVAE